MIAFLWDESANEDVLHAWRQLVLVAEAGLPGELANRVVFLPLR